MSRDSLSRRDFNKLSMAALGGLAAGTAIGCGNGEEDPGDDAGAGGQGGDHTAATGGGHDAGDTKVSGADCWTSGEHNVCRGLNVCKGHGKGDHDCAGKAQCASIADHSCHGENDCACQGGCGETVGENACKGKGECAVPLTESWKKARERFEKALTAAGKEFSPAPAAAG